MVVDTLQESTFVYCRNLLVQYLSSRKPLLAGSHRKGEIFLYCSGYIREKLSNKVTRYSTINTYPYLVWGVILSTHQAL